MYTCKQLERCVSESSVMSDAASGVMGDFKNYHSLTRSFVTIEGRGISFPRLACCRILNVCHSQCRSLQVAE